MEKKGARNIYTSIVGAAFVGEGFFWFFFFLLLLQRIGILLLPTCNVESSAQSAFGYKQASMSRWRKDRGKIVGMGRKPARRLLHLAGEREMFVCLFFLFFAFIC